MHLIETHAHLDDPRFAEDLEAVLSRADAADVKRMIVIGTGIQSSCNVIALAERYSSLYAAIGIHPTNIEEEEVAFLSQLRVLAAHPKVVAIGEIGIDYFHSQEGLSLEEVTAWKARQAVAFRQQLDLAVELDLNVIIHQRDVAGSSLAWEETLRILHPYSGKLRAVFHCFGGSIAQAQEVARMGHLISFTGIITFKNAPTVREVAAAVASDGYMIETDCPYLAPAPYRGTRAEPAHVRLVAEKIAEVRKVSLEEVAAATTATAEKFFRWNR